MSISQTPKQPIFPYRGTPEQPDEVTRSAPMPTPAILRNTVLFGIPLKSFLTGQEVTDEGLQYYIDVAISEVEHALDLYINPVEFDERHDYSRHLQFWSFGYMKIDHSPVRTVKKYELTFNNGLNNGQVLVDVPLEFIHTQPMEGTVQLVPAQGVTIAGFIASLYSGMGYHAFNSGVITNWPGAVHIVYDSGFGRDKVPALLSGLIANMAALQFLSVMGPILFPYNSVSIGIDGTSQSTGTLGPAFLQLRIKELQDMIDKQMDIARSYYQKKFFIESL